MADVNATKSVTVTSGINPSHLARIDFSWWCVDTDSNDLYCATCGEYVKDYNAKQYCSKCGLPMVNARFE